MDAGGALRVDGRQSTAVPVRLGTARAWLKIKIQNVPAVLVSKLLTLDGIAPYLKIYNILYRDAARVWVSTGPRVAEATPAHVKHTPRGRWLQNVHGNVPAPTAGGRPRNHAAPPHLVPRGAKGLLCIVDDGLEWRPSSTLTWMTVWPKNHQRRFVDDGLQKRPSSTFSSMTVSN